MLRKMQSLTFRLRLILALTLILSVLPGAGAVVLMERAQKFEVQANYAHEVLGLHLILGQKGHALAHHTLHEGVLTDPIGVKLKRQLDSVALETRKLIATEVAIRGSEGIDEEGEELERIDKIMLSLNIALQGNQDARWIGLIDEAVEEERREVKAIDQRELAALRDGTTLLIVSAAAVALLMLSVMVFAQRAVASPLNEFLRATNGIAQGLTGERVGTMPFSEFRELATSLNKMAEKLETRQIGLEENAQRLESEVSQRTAELAKANTILTESADRRTQFLTDISHELRTPLAVIRGDAEVTLRGSDKPLAEYKSTLVRIAAQVVGLTKLVDDLLYVARNEAGAPKVTMRPMDLVPLLRASANALLNLVEADGGVISTSAEADSAMILGDSNRLTQLLTILLDNAIHYSDGPPQIDIALLPSTDGFAVLVTDHGIGIARSEIGSVFDRFHRGKNGNDKNEAGLGIGLPMAKAIVEAHGGRITIESELGQGTTVSVFLPAAQKLRLADEHFGH